MTNLGVTSNFTCPQFMNRVEDFLFLVKHGLFRSRNLIPGRHEVDTTSGPMESAAFKETASCKKAK